MTSWLICCTLKCKKFRGILLSPQVPRSPWHCADHTIFTTDMSFLTGVAKPISASLAFISCFLLWSLYLQHQQTMQVGRRKTSKTKVTMINVRATLPIRTSQKYMYIFLDKFSSFDRLRYRPICVLHHDILFIVRLKASIDSHIFEYNISFILNHQILTNSY